jgi:hypothetical protein
VRQAILPQPHTEIWEEPQQHIYVVAIILHETPDRGCPDGVFFCPFSERRTT